MTQFNPDDFSFDGMYLTYSGQFVGRFKHQSRDCEAFTRFLIEHFTVEEYFRLHAEGMSPVTILETKGYVSATVKELLTRAGYEPTQAGFKAYVNDARPARVEVEPR